MLVAAKNCDIISFELISQRNRLDLPLKEDLMRLMDAIRHTLLSEQKVKFFLDKLLSQIFDLRLKAIKWLLENKSIDIHESLDQTTDYLEALKSDKKVANLAENLLFALRWNRRVVNALARDSQLIFSAEAIPVMSYNQFVKAIAWSIPDEKVAQKIVDWTNSSMCIEFAALCISLITEEKLNVSKKVIDEIASLTASSAQLYAALASEFGILGAQKVKSYVLPAFDEEYVNEQRSLADQGLDDYGENLLNDET